MNDSVIKVNERQDGYLTTIFLSSSNPKNIRGDMFKYGDVLMKNGKKIDTSHLIEFEANYSIVRVYRDIFLVYDSNVNSWVLVRIFVS